jgi:quercetin dioxygenase-like cupin family protein
MHLTPNELRMLRQDGTVVRFALLDAMAFVVAEVSPIGSAGTPLEAPCVRPHWGFVIAGELLVEMESRRQRLKAGSAFHLPPGGPTHRLIAPGEARIAGFEPVDPTTDTTDAALVAKGFELVGPDQVGAALVVPPLRDPLLEPNQVDARSWSMSGLVLTQARFGAGSGYTSEWCDAAHWGIVTSGRLAIEWEDDVEILAAGDVYHCPGGPPGHRLEAADPASVIDLTPIEAVTDGRLASWRILPAQAAKRSARGGRIAVAGLG